MSDIRIQQRPDPAHEGLQHLELHGTINATSVLDFQKTVDVLLARDVHRFIIDFRDVSYINSTGMGILVQYTDTCRKHGGNVVLLNIQPKVKVAFDILGLDDFFSMTSDPEAARLAALQKPESAADKVQADSDIREFRTKTDAAFPKVVQCHFCHLPIRIEGKGKFICPACNTDLAVAADGGILFQCRASAIPLKLSLPYTQMGFKSALEFILFLARQHGFDETDTGKISTSVSEILDAVSKADPQRQQALFTVMCASDAEHFRLRFTDSGAAFPINEAEFLTKTRYLMDKIQYKPNPKGGNILQVAKLLRKK